MLAAIGVVWLATRSQIYMMDTWIVHYYNHLFSDTGDVMLYQQWLHFFFHGHFPAHDSRWQYPAGAAAILSLPHLLRPLGYMHAFFVLALAADLVITLLVARLAMKKGSWLGCWCWVLGIPLLGPSTIARFDVFVALLVVIALCLSNTRWGFGVFAGLGAMVKVWPVLLLVGARRFRDNLIAAVVTCAVVGGAYLLFTTGSLSFISHQNNRGLEIESLGAIPFLIAQDTGIAHYTTADKFGSYQLYGPGVGVAADVMLVLNVAALVAVVWLRLRARSWPITAVGDFAIVATLAFVVTSRVISPQYMIWLLGLVACAVALPRSSQRPVAILLLVAAGLTQLEFPIEFRHLLHFGTSGIVFVTLRNIVLLVALVWGFMRLRRATRDVGEEPSAAAPSPAHATER